MATSKAIVIQSGQTKQIPNADTLLTGVGIDQSATGALSIGVSNANAINIGKVGITMTIKGDFQVDGTEIVVGETTFQDNAVFEGNITLGNAVTDTITFTGRVAGDINALKEVNHTIGVDASTTATTVGGNLTLTAGDGNGAAGGNFSIDAGTGTSGGVVNVGGTNASDVNIGNATSNPTIDLLGSGQKTIAGNLDATSGLDVSGGALTVDNQAITQTTGGQVTFAGNVDADSGLDVSGGRLTSGEAKSTYTARNLVPADLGVSSEVHFRPDELTSPGLLSPWPDESGNSNDATPSGTSPTVALDQTNGLSEVQFNGASNLTTGSSVPGEPITIAVVLQPNTFVGSPNIIRGNATNGISLTFGTGGNYLLGQRGVANFTPSNTALTTGQRAIIVATYDLAGNFTYFLDGLADGSGLDNRTIATQILDIGSSLDTDFNEILVYNSVLSTSDREKVEGNLAWKYGLEGNLPVGHTYKDAPPTTTVGRGTVFIGGAANPSAVLDLSSISQGVLLPRMTSTQRDAITSPAEGLRIYNNTTNQANLFNGTVWRQIVTTTIDLGGLVLTDGGITMTGLDLGGSSAEIGDMYTDGFIRFGESADPTAVANKGFLYAKDDGGDTELFYRDDSGNIVQLTQNGEIGGTGSKINGLTTTGLADGDFGYYSSAKTITKTDSAAIGTSRAVGANEGVASQMSVAGIIESAKFTTVGGSPSVGAQVFLAAAADDTSTGAGKLTATAPSSGVVAEIGLCQDNADYAGSKTAEVLFQPKTPIVL